MECNKLVTVCEVSLFCYMVKSIVKKIIQRVPVSLPSFGKDIAWCFPVCVAGPDFQFPLICDWILLLVHNIYLWDKLKIDIVIRSKAFREKNQWDNRSLGRIQQQFICFK